VDGFGPVDIKPNQQERGGIGDSMLDDLEDGRIVPPFQGWVCVGGLTQGGAARLTPLRSALG